MVELVLRVERRPGASWRPATSCASFRSALATALVFVVLTSLVSSKFEGVRALTCAFVIQVFLLSGIRVIRRGLHERGLFEAMLRLGPVAAHPALPHLLIIGGAAKPRNSCARPPPWANATPPSASSRRWKRRPATNCAASACWARSPPSTDVLAQLRDRRPLSRRHPVPGRRPDERLRGRAPGPTEERGRAPAAPPRRGRDGPHRRRPARDQPGGTAQPPAGAPGPRTRPGPGRRPSRAGHRGRRQHRLGAVPADRRQRLRPTDPARRVRGQSVPHRPRDRRGLADPVAARDAVRRARRLARRSRLRVRAAGDRLPRRRPQARHPGREPSPAKAPAPMCWAPATWPWPPRRSAPRTWR
jgi:hypothetical protein